MEDPKINEAEKKLDTTYKEQLQAKAIILKRTQRLCSACNKPVYFCDRCKFAFNEDEKIVCSNGHFHKVCLPVAAQGPMGSFTLSPSPIGKIIQVYGVIFVLVILIGGIVSLYFSKLLSYIIYLVSFALMGFVLYKQWPNLKKQMQGKQ